MKNINIQILLLRLALGALFLNAGLSKINDGWLTSDQELLSSLTTYQQKASTDWQKRYLETVALPYVSIWAKMIPLGEVALGASLLLGLLTRFSTAMGIIMVLNLHAANGNLFTFGFFQTPYAALVLACLLALFLSRAGRWFGFELRLHQRRIGPR